MKKTEPMLIEMKKKGAKWFGRCESSRWQWAKIPFPRGYSFARVKRIWGAEWERDGVPVRIVLVAA